MPHKNLLSVVQQLEWLRYVSSTRIERSYLCRFLSLFIQLFINLLICLLYYALPSTAFHSVVSLIVSVQAAVFHSTIHLYLNILVASFFIVIFFSLGNAVYTSIPPPILSLSLCLSLSLSLTLSLSLSLSVCVWVPPSYPPSITQSLSLPACLFTLSGWLHDSSVRFPNPPVPHQIESILIGRLNLLHAARKQEILKLTEQLLEAISSGDYEIYS